MTHFWKNTGPTGCGKTRAATKFACERIPRQVKTVILQPTIRLCKQSMRDARTRFPDRKAKVRCIVSQRDAGEKVARRITNYLNTRDESGELLYLTHAGFLRTEYWHRAEDWHLFVDEAMDVTYHRQFRLKKEHRNLLTGSFRLLPYSEKYSVLEATDHGQLMEVLHDLGEDEIDEHFVDLTSRLVAPHWNLYVDTELFRRFEAGEVNQFEVHGLMHPSIFDPFASVTLMAANLTDSIMYKYFAKVGCKFSEHPAIARGIQYAQHLNGNRLIIKYLSDRKWSKTLRDTSVRKPGDDEDDCGMSVGQIYMELCQREAAKHSPRLRPMWIGNNDIRIDEFDGVRLQNVPHGMNDLQDYTVCCVMSALNPPERHRAFLQEMCGMTERQIRRAILSQTSYQALGRGVLRNLERDDLFLLIVPDRDTAEDIASYYPGCQIEKLANDCDMPQSKGRPVKYDSSEAKRDAHRIQKSASMRRSRWKAKNSKTDVWTNYPISKGVMSTPCNPDSAGFYVSTWNSRATRPRPAELWEPETYRHLWNQASYTTAEFFLQLRHRYEAKVYDDKFDNWLFSPTLFDLSRKPDQGHCLENVAVVKGIVLDIDGTAMTPDIIASILAPYELVIYSSFNHCREDPSYRVVIPTTEAMTSDASKAIRMMCVQRFRDHGFGEKLAAGPKHGVDTGKLHSAALFFWPCARPDGFFCHYREGGPAIDPREWVGQCPAVIIDTITGTDPEEIPRPRCATYGTEHRDRRVQRAIDYWRQHGCIKGSGRTQLWFFARRLAEAGCDDGEIRGILYEQAGYATNPVERRGEIEDLLKDSRVRCSRRAA